jgi:hypothetical protein
MQQLLAMRSPQGQGQQMGAGMGNGFPNLAPPMQLPPLGGGNFQGPMSMMPGYNPVAMGGVNSGFGNFGANFGNVGPAFPTSGIGTY